MRFQLLLLFFLFATSVIAQTSDNPYDTEYKMSNGLIRVEYKGKYGYIDEKRKEVIPLQFADAQDFYDGLAKVSIDKKKYGYINERGETVVPFHYDAFLYGFQNGYSPAQKDGKWGIVSDNGKTVVPHKYQSVYYYFDRLAVASKIEGNELRYGYLDEKGKEAVTFKYVDATSFTEGVAAVSEGSGYGYIDTKGKVVIPFQYETAQGFYEGLAAVRVKGKWGFIDKKNNMVIQPLYNQVYSFKNGECEVLMGGQAFRIDRHGKRLKPGKWLMIFTKGLKLGEQYWYRNEKYTDVIYEKFKEGFRYSDVAYNQHEKELFIIMSKYTAAWQTGLQYNSTYDQIWKKIQNYYNDNKSITSLAYGDGKWSLIATDLGVGLQESAVSNTYLPMKEIREAWAKGKFITNMVYGGDRWIVTMRKANYEDQFIKEYDYDRWDQEDVEKQLKKGYAITNVAIKGHLYTVVFTKGTGIKDQLLVWSDELPLREIKGYWDEGYKCFKNFYITRSVLIGNSDLWDAAF
jgi:hypothetical protein